MPKHKLYILDTNVLIHDPKAITSFEHASVGIPLTVIEELDHFKKDSSQKGFSAREAIRTLDALRARGSLRDGVKLDNGTVVRVLSQGTKKQTELEYPCEADNRILSMTLAAQREGFDVEFISKDLNMRVKADALGIRAVDYLRQTITGDDFYKGWRTLGVPAVQLKQTIPPLLAELSHDIPLMPNEYIIVHAQHNEHNYRILRHTGEHRFAQVETPEMRWPFQPRNVQQLMALDLLFNNDIPVVSLLGPAGTGKTLLVLVAALYKVLVEQSYRKLLVSRPIIPLGPDIGYLPGELQEKLYNWMQPVYDNMELISHIISGTEPGAHTQQQHKNHYHDQTPKHQNSENDQKRQDRQGRDKEQRKHKHHTHHNGHHTAPWDNKTLSVERLVAQDRLSLEAITYMRGRSIPYRYIFIDEVQNLTPHEVKTIVSRVGDGSKIVLAGDPYQIDSPYLDFSSNGLTVVTDRFKGQSIFGTIFLEQSERSAISRLAAALL